MRTTLTDADGNPRYTNRLVREDSPYLRQHAHNPVDWFPWGEEAFSKAVNEDKPVFLSIGYATCHWCHVMEHESFDDEEVAAYLNEHFIAVKLDREQRPDIDEIYMTGVQLTTGHGGWPMSSFLTGQGKPFHAGTYFPRDGFLALLQQIETLWRTRRKDVLAQADRVSDAIAEYSTAQSQRRVPGDVFGQAVKELESQFDLKSGGFGTAPKFPNEVQLQLLLEDVRRRGSKTSEGILRTTLDRIYQGGICDQVAGGFHRYAVDSEWLVPHFEKMLYNQAQLLSVFARAATVLGEPAYARVATETADYVLRDMRSGEGLFYSATDADSEGVEGRFFVWQIDELRGLFSPEDFDLVCSLYGVTEKGNFEGENVLHLTRSLEASAAAAEIPVSKILEKVKAIRSTLYSKRMAREAPFRDEKILTAWNGMMISALAVAGIELARQDYLSAAAEAAESLWQRHWQEGQLCRNSLNGRTSVAGSLEDYAGFMAGMLQLYRSDSDGRWLSRSEQLAEAMHLKFWDGTEGGYFMGVSDNEAPLITRPKNPRDGATPSANSLAAAVLVELWFMTGRLAYRERVEQLGHAFSGLLIQQPSALPVLVSALECFGSGQSGRVQYAAEGRVRVELNPDQLIVDIAPGWHINDGVPFEGSVETRVEGDERLVCRFPSSEKVLKPYYEAPRGMYSGRVVIALNNPAGAPVTIQLQACDDQRCLAPVELVMTA